MRSRDPEVGAAQLLASLQRDGQRTRPVALGPIDRDKLFLPPEHSQLFYSPLWSDLDRRHQLRYSQLYALRTNEVIMLFERFLVRAVLPPIARRVAARRLPRLRELLLQMIREEAEHDAGFTALNRASRPDLYDHTDFFFFPPRASLRALVTLLGVAAHRLACPLWLLFFIEESSLVLARDLAARRSDGLASPEPNWLAVHRQHTRDERRHTVIDRLLFEHCYGDRGSLARYLDGHLFKALLRGIMCPAPRGAGVRVVEQLICDYPELAGMRNAMVREIVALRRNQAFRASLLSPRLAPQAWRLFHRCPELDTLAGFIPGYA